MIPIGFIEQLDVFDDMIPHWCVPLYEVVGHFRMPAIWPSAVTTTSLLLLHPFSKRLFSFPSHWSFMKFPKYWYVLYTKFYKNNSNGIQVNIISLPFKYVFKGHSFVKRTASKVQIIGCLSEQGNLRKTKIFWGFIFS